LPGYHWRNGCVSKKFQEDLQETVGFRPNYGMVLQNVPSQILGRKKWCCWQQKWADTRKEKHLIYWINMKWHSIVSSNRKHKTNRRNVSLNIMSFSDHLQHPGKFVYLSADPSKLYIYVYIIYRIYYKVFMSELIVELACFPTVLSQTLDPSCLSSCLHDPKHIGIDIHDPTNKNKHSYGHLLVITGYFYGIMHSINGVTC
jgi:hypothetical protein